ncbi:MAG: DUF6036 family nucleotidyltransferase [Gordonia amarae]
MRRDQLEHAIRAACEILKCDEVIIVGSQSILGTWDEIELPGRATETNEADIMAIDPDNRRVMAMADALEGAAGEMSPFHDTHGFYLDGVDESTSILPDGWRERVVPVRNANTNYHTGWCLDPNDLCVAKLAAFREKDSQFVAALIASRKIDARTVLARMELVPSKYSARCDRARDWLRER